MYPATDRRTHVIYTALKSNKEAFIQDTDFVDIHELRRLMQKQYDAPHFREFLNSFNKKPVMVEHGEGYNGYTKGVVGNCLKVVADSPLPMTGFVRGDLNVHSDRMLGPDQRRVLDDVINGTLGYVSLTFSYAYGPDGETPLDYPDLELVEISLTSDPARPVRRHKMVKYSNNSIMSSSAANTAAPQASAPSAAAPQGSATAPPTSAPQAAPVTPVSPVVDAPPSGSKTETAPVAIGTTTAADQVAIPELDLGFTVGTDGKFSMNQPAIPSLSGEPLEALSIATGLDSESIAKMSPSVQQNMMRAAIERVTEISNLKRAHEDAVKANEEHVAKFVKFEKEASEKYADVSKKASIYETGAKSLVGSVFKDKPEMMATPEATMSSVNGIIKSLVGQISEVGQRARDATVAERTLASHHQPGSSAQASKQQAPVAPTTAAQQQQQKPTMSEQAEHFGRTLVSYSKRAQNGQLRTQTEQADAMLLNIANQNPAFHDRINSIETNPYASFRIDPNTASGSF